MRCGNVLCVQCSSQRVDGVVCNDCLTELPPEPAPVPHDLSGPWLASMYETSLLVWREPYRLFSRLADGPVSPAWNFLFCWSVVTHAVLALEGQEQIARVLTGLLMAGLGSGLSLVLYGTLLYVALRTFGAKLPWSLALRAEGYTAAWLAPGVLLRALVLPFADDLTVWWSGLILSALVTTLGSGYAYYALARERARLRPLHAALVAVIVALPSFVAFVAWTATRGAISAADEQVAE
ncbi:MAG: hypothetical protein JWN04_1803 [Myxococcaceae bacterium]|nr:hypothetical protein [Myxococcaceae bacterium]